MNEIKVSMVKFLMTMFETSSDSVQSVRMFKNNVQELVRRNQIPGNVRDLVYNMYGIANTDTFKPNTQSNKLMQVNMLMMRIDSAINGSSGESVSSVTSYIESGVRAGGILKSARDIVFDIYDLDTVSSKPQSTPKASTTPVVGKINTTRPPVSSGSTLSAMNQTHSGKKLKEVQKDIAQFKSQYVPEIYYEYPNPSYDGCSGSSRYLHKKLIEATERPVSATFTILKVISDDGCHQTRSFVNVPKEYYKPTTTQNPYPITAIKTPMSGGAVGCTGGGYVGRVC